VVSLELRRCTTMYGNVAHTGKDEALSLRVTAAQAAWLRDLAEREYEGNFSAAVRRALTDARLLEMARDDFDRLQRDNGMRLPANEGGEATVLETILSVRSGWSLQAWDADR